MNITEVRSVIRQTIAEAMEKNKLSKSNGTLMELKKELKSLEGMREALGQYQIAEGDESTPGFVAEYAHMQKFVNELNKIKEAHARLAEMLDSQISQVKGKVVTETQKIKEMMGLIEKAKKPAAKKDDKKAAKKDDKKEDKKEKKADLKEGQIISIRKDFNLDGKDFKKGQTITTQPDFNTIEAAGKAGKIKQGEHFVMGVGGHMEEAYFKKKGKELDEASYKVSPNAISAQNLKKGDIITSGEEVVSVSAGAKTPSGKVEVTLTKDGKTRTAVWGKSTKVGVKK
jgi:flagellar biosynthesis chaperone FliJ